jgi:hypothetical protein
MLTTLRSSGAHAPVAPKKTCVAARPLGFGPPLPRIDPFGHKANRRSISRSRRQRMLIVAFSLRSPLLAAQATTFVTAGRSYEQKTATRL